MGKRKNSNQNILPPPNISESQIRLTHAEMVDRSGELPELDLHGQTAQEASISIFSYISRMAESGESCCRIIHGKGTGVLKEVVEHELENFIAEGIVNNFFQSKKYPGAAVVIIFHP